MVWRRRPSHRKGRSEKPIEYLVHERKESLAQGPRSNVAEGLEEALLRDLKILPNLIESMEEAG